MLQKFKNLFKRKEKVKVKTHEEDLFERFTRGEILQVDNHVDNLKFIKQKEDAEYN